MKAKWLVWLLFLPMHAAAQQYVAINLPTSIGTEFSVAGINPSGTEIVGSYMSGGNSNGVRLNDGEFYTVSFPTGPGLTNWSYAVGVNDASTVVGTYFPASPAPISPEYGMSYSGNGGYAAYVAPGPKMTWITAVNNPGDVVGYYQDWGCDGLDCNQRGFLLSKGKFVTLEFPGATRTRAAGINSLGEIVGNYDSSAGSQGFTWSTGTYHAFTTVSGATLTGINDSGDIVGTTSSGSFLLSGGVVYKILFPGSTETSVTGVTNRKGDTVKVVGNYTDSKDVSHGYYAVVTLP